MMIDKKKLIYVISFIDFSYGIEWVADHMNKEKYEIDFILLNKEIPKIYYILKNKNVNVFFIKYTGKWEILKVIIQLFVYFRKHKPAIVHAHLFDASLASMTAGWLAGVKKRIYTRHHADAHHEQHPHAVKYDKLINYLATDIIAVSESVKSVLVGKEKSDASKVFVVHHGFDFEMTKVNAAEITAMKIKYGLTGYNPVIGVISRFFERKGVQYIIPAFKKLLTDFPGAKLVLANAKGSYIKEIMEALKELPSGNYITIDHEQKIYSLFKCFDIFVHAPVDVDYEAFGQIYVEAMSCKVPVVCTISGVAKSYVLDRKNALVVPYRNSEKIYEGMKELLVNVNFRNSITAQAYLDVINNFQVIKMINELEQIYG